MTALIHNRIHFYRLKSNSYKGQTINSGKKIETNCQSERRYWRIKSVNFEIELLEYWLGDPGNWLLTNL